METPYKDLLYTNIVPSDEECRRIRDFVVAPMNEVAELNPEIARLQSLLGRLTRRRDDLKEVIDSHLALVSPARKLPHDIVREIFKVASSANPYSTMSLTQSPLQLSHVCRDWRALALSMPGLWNSLQVAVDTDVDAPNPEIRVKKVNDGLKSWLPRSAGLPLSISLVSYGFGNDCSILLQTLMEVSHRWDCMRFLLPSYSFFSPFETLSPIDVPMLKTIAIDVGSQDRVRVPPNASYMAFAGAPNICSISLRRPMDPFHYPLNWEELRNISIGHYGRRTRQSASSFVTALPLLRRCAKLETLAMPIHDWGDITVPVPLHLAFLWRLSIVDCTSHTADTTCFFEHSVLPNLHHLEYTSFKIHPLPLTFLASLRAPERLTSLSLNMSLSAIDLANGLRHVPMLQDLVICSRVHKNCELFTLLTSQYQVPIVCPNLRTITSYTREVGSDQELLEMILSRTGAGTQPLSVVHVTFSRYKEIDIIPQLQPLIDEGLKMTLCYPTDSITSGADYLSFSTLNLTEKRREDPDLNWELPLPGIGFLSGMEY
ncbi:hypothetical protein FB451DRAFT_767631 [Mycena latifolia]|nr:hypothetical protein FB451DRAFT_767631 [Mycena latifolia]